MENCFSLPLIQEEQVASYGKRMCTKIGKLLLVDLSWNSDHPDMTSSVYHGHKANQTKVELRQNNSAAEIKRINEPHH